MVSNLDSNQNQDVSNLKPLASPMVGNGRGSITLNSVSSPGEQSISLPLISSQNEICLSDLQETKYSKRKTSSESDVFDPHTHSLSLGCADLDIIIVGYNDNSTGRILYYTLGVLSLGFLLLLGRWLPSIPIWFAATPSDLRNASWVIVTNQYGQKEKITIQTVKYPGEYRKLFSYGDNSYTIKQDIAQAEEITQLRLFHYRFLTLIYDPIYEKFYQLSHWQDTRWDDLSLCHQGLTYETFNERKILFSKNEILIPTKSIPKLLIDEVLHPFFIFQIFSIILWSCEQYYYYAASIFIISLVSIIQSLIQTRANWKRVQDLSRFECPVEVFRNDSWITVSSFDLVPGDIFNLLTPGLNTLPCDSVLLQGDCVIGEGMLTGESVPVSKVPLEQTDLLFEELGFNQSGSNQFSPQFAQSVLFSGTQIIRARGSFPLPKLHSIRGQNAQAIAMVIRTGFNTTKGALVRSILFPRPNVFKFYRDSFRFIGVMSAIALIGFVISLYLLINLGMSGYYIIIRTLDLATIVVPPALPATMSVGMSFALSRLQSKGVFCIAPSRINVSGKVDLACFDKTGTLTEEGLDVLGAQENLHSENQLSNLTNPNQLVVTNDKLQLFHCLTTCHSIKVVNKELLGDVLEVRMFEATGWVLEEGESNHDSFASQLGLALVRPSNQPRFSLDTLNNNQDYSELAILKAFEFVPALRRMSVLVRAWRSNSIQVYTKGAPEVIATLCAPETLPIDFSTQLKAYTQKGYRVIACAGRELGELSWPLVQDSNRHELERNLTFLGFVVFENRLKPATAPAIKSLHDAAIRQVMCTGDNLLTAISVARECGLLPPDVVVFSPRLTDVIIWESVDYDDSGDYASAPLLLDPSTLIPPGGIKYALAVSGDCFRVILDSCPKTVIDRMLVKAQVFARMAPEEKQELVERLQELDYCVAFCGDGANDCGALKAADVGLSLSEAEASVAAPFTSKILDISSILLLIKEGRAALVTSFSCFKYMGLYSIIQFVTIIIIYIYGGNLGDYQFLLFDLFIILPVAVAMGRTQASPTLYSRAPTASLVSKKMLSSFIGQCLIQIIFQVSAYYYLISQNWFEPPEIDTNEPNVSSMVNTTLFYISGYQYLWGAIVFSVGYPYRRSMFSNIPFIATLAIIFGFLAWVQLKPMEWQTKLFELVDIPSYFNYILLGIAGANLLVAYLHERFGVPGLVHFMHVIQRINRKQTHFKGPRSFALHSAHKNGPLVMNKKFQFIENEIDSDLYQSV